MLRAARRLRAQLTCSGLRGDRFGEGAEVWLNPEVGRRGSEGAQSGAQRPGASGEPWVPGNGSMGRSPREAGAGGVAGSPARQQPPPGRPGRRLCLRTSSLW